MALREMALAFVEALNSYAPEDRASLMTDDHAFIDSDGTRQTGKDALRRIWQDYFALVPDDRLHVEETLDQGPTVAFLGEPEGTFARDGRLDAENHWRVPAAWRAIVRDGKVAVWQVYVNPEPLARILNRLDGE